MVGRGDDDGIDGLVGENLAVVRVGLRLSPGAGDGALDAALISVHDPGEFDAGHELHRLHDLVGARARTDHAETDAVVSGNRAGAGNRGKRGGALDKIASA